MEFSVKVRGPLLNMWGLAFGVTRHNDIFLALPLR